MSYKCQQCGKQYKIDLMVSDTTWKSIRPPLYESGSGLLCPSCIMVNIAEWFEDMDTGYARKFGLDEDDGGYASFNLTRTPTA